MAASALAFAKRHCKYLLCRSLKTCASTMAFSPTLLLLVSAAKLRIEGVLPKLLLNPNPFRDLVGLGIPLDGVGTILLGEDGLAAPLIELLGEEGLAAPLTELLGEDGRRAPLTELLGEDGRRAPLTELLGEDGRRAPLTGLIGEAGRTDPLTGLGDSPRGDSVGPSLRCL